MVWWPGQKQVLLFQTAGCPWLEETGKSSGRRKLVPLVRIFPGPDLHMKTGYLIDTDGVLYRENHLIDGAADFVRALLATGTPFLFLTNNSAPTPADLAVRMKHLGIAGLSAHHFYTSALNTAEFLSETDP